MLSGITEGGFGIMLFTTHDCMDAARPALAQSVALEGASPMMIRGTIVNEIPGEGVIGVVINAFGPGPPVEVWWQ